MVSTDERKTRESKPFHNEKLNNQCNLIASNKKKSHLNLNQACLTRHQLLSNYTSASVFAHNYAIERSDLQRNCREISVETMRVQEIRTAYIGTP